MSTNDDIPWAFRPGQAPPPSPELCREAGQCVICTRLKGHEGLHQDALLFDSDVRGKCDVTNLRSDPLSFWEWLKGQKKRDDRVGDVAKDLLMDLVNHTDTWPEKKTPEAIRKYLKCEALASDRCVAAFEAAVEEWKAL